MERQQNRTEAYMGVRARPAAAREESLRASAASSAATAPTVRVLVGETGSRKLLARIQAHGWGRMWTTKRPTLYDGEPWGFDNGAWGAYCRGKRFPAEEFRRRVERARALPAPYLAVLPDMVARGLGSVKMSIRWLESGELPAWPWYLAVQNGCCAQEVVAELTGDSSALSAKSFEAYRGRARVAGLFLGGTDAFKATALTWRIVATQLGIRFHYARAGTPRKIRYALASGADSFDSALPLRVMWRFDRFEKMVTLGDPEHFMFPEAAK